MAELQEKVSQYIGIKSSKICLPITEEDRQEFCKIIADQEKMTNIIIEDYRFLQHHGHNGKEGDWIHIGWLLGCDIKELVIIGAVAGKDTASVPPTEIIWDEGLEVERVPSGSS
ncbi:hypothetical protein C1646_775235 [Rhizophagus diaphanus]|nr:hypothetical protein C1646_775235 [Rhizophagus diaphanus] [Rhizophagus sp. MUCL 43196]